MELALEIFGPASLVSAVVALAISGFSRRIVPTRLCMQAGFGWLCVARRSTPGRGCGSDSTGQASRFFGSQTEAGLSGRCTLPAALAIGFVAGYFALPRAWAALIPKQEHHWLPYLGIAAAMIAGASNHCGRSAGLRWPAYIFLSVLAGGALTPSWPVFGVTKPLSIAVTTAYFLLIIALLELLPSRLLGKGFVGLVAIAAAIATAAIGIEVSVRMAQLAAIVSGGLAGCWLGQFCSAKSSEPEVRALIPVFAVLVGGASFLSAVEPDPPIVLLLASPMTPLAVWLVALIRPRGQTSGGSN